MRARAITAGAALLALGACSPLPPPPPRVLDDEPLPCPTAAATSEPARAPAIDPFTAALGRIKARFPAPILVADDGSRIAVGPSLATRSYSGITGETSLIGLVKILDTGADRVVDFVTVDVPRGDPGPAAARLAAVEQALAARAWEKLPEYRLEPDPAAPAPKRADAPKAVLAKGEGLVVRYREPSLTVTRDDGTTVMRRDFPRWTMRSMLPEAGSGCAARGVMTGLWGRVDRGVLLIELGYDGPCVYKGGYHAVRLGG